MSAPFEYPAISHTRRHGPVGYLDYESYRPWLRDEFAFRCVYCLLREVWGPAKGNYEIDHFVPTVYRADFMFEYDNLLYTCSTCNLSKGQAITPDPLTHLVAPEVRVSEDGSMDANTKDAKKLIDLLGLNRPSLRELRELWIRILRLAELHDQALKHRILSYPEHLPDLSVLRPPNGNNRLEGIEQSHFARRQRGELPPTY